MKHICVGAVIALLGGCYPHYMDYEYYEDGPPPDGVMVQEAPPEPLAEEMPPEPFAGAIWVDGYWNWSGHRYMWIRGRYLRAPRPGVVWFHGGYVRVRGGYVYVAGRWAPPGYQVRYRYVYQPRWYGHGWYRQSHPRGRVYRGGRYYGPRGYRGGPRGYRGGPRGYDGGPRGYRGPAPRGYRGPGPSHHGGGHAVPPAPRHRAPAAGGGGGRHRAPSAGGGGRSHRAPPAP